jgi:hypothetical protein
MFISLLLTVQMSTTPYTRISYRALCVLCREMLESFWTVSAAVRGTKVNGLPQARPAEQTTVTSDVLPRRES